jgi:thiosulfate/3-mercaptopyruvate sulfurtransferase
MTYQTLIDATDLARLVEQGDVLICDCRFDLGDLDAGRRDYRTGHIPGAVHVDLERDLSAAPTGSNGRHPLPERAAFAARMAQLGVTQDGLVVTYDTSGGFYASRLWWMLRWAGHGQAAVLDGGIKAWTEAGHALEQGEVQPIPGNFSASAEAAMPITEVEVIEANIAGGDLLVVDARTADRFAGAPHPLDATSGHIPGAGNRFWQNNLAPDGRFKPAGDLAREFAALLGDRAATTIVHQCGSGVTATHNLLAMEAAGLTGSRLYPGSWSEWTSDPRRPIARERD